jgi:hypothetical protein
MFLHQLANSLCGTSVVQFRKILASCPSAFYAQMCFLWQFTNPRREAPLLA